MGIYRNVDRNRDLARAKFKEVREQNPNKGADWCIQQVTTLLAETAPSGMLALVRRNKTDKPYSPSTIRQWVHGRTAKGRMGVGEDLVCPGGVHHAPPLVGPQEMTPPPPGMIATTILARLDDLGARMEAQSILNGHRALTLVTAIDNLHKLVLEQVGDLVAVEVAGGNGRMKREARKRFPASLPLGE